MTALPVEHWQPSLHRVEHRLGIAVSSNGRVAVLREHHEGRLVGRGVGQLGKPAGDGIGPLTDDPSELPPLVTDINLSVDDHWLYVSCWGTGELKQYDVSDPFQTRETASVRLGGIVKRAPHAAAPDLPLGGGSHMIEIGRDDPAVHQTRLQGGDASSDSYCYTS